MVKSLLKQLFLLAARWRTQHDQGLIDAAEQTVRAYHAVLAQLWDLSWDRQLEPMEELPDNLMPGYYIDYWNAHQRPPFTRPAPEPARPPAQPID